MIFDYVKRRNSDGEVADLKWGKIIGHIVIVLILLVFIFGSFGTIPSGFRGVRTQFSKVEGIVQPGLYFKLPLIQHVVSMDVQTQKDTTDATAASSDLQNVTATVAINYHVEPQDVATIFQNIGEDYANRVIAPAIQEAIKATTANYTAEELITKRESVRDAISSTLATKLAAYGVKTDTLNITNFAFSKSFTDAIEAKVTAVQNAEAAKNKLVQIQVEAQQAIAKAEGEAKAISVKGAALQNNPGVVELNWIDKWSGQVPTYWGNATPFIGLTK
jgi:prohibitin 2